VLKKNYYFYIVVGYFFIFSSIHASAQNKDLSQSLFSQYATLYQIDTETKKNTLSPALIALGQKIFSDIRLSDNGKMACQTCHQPELAFSDTHAKAIGNNGKALTRKSMTLYHIKDDTQFFWDGRAKTLEEQFLMALENPEEMNFSLDRAINIIKQDPHYQKLLNNIAAPLSKNLIIKAVVTFVKSIKPPETRFDHWLSGNLKALSKQELLGFEVFNTKANCTACHIGYKFKDDLLNDIGLPDKDLGYGAITKNPDDHHMFKTPSLRGVLNHAPYMHDGSLKTLKDVVDHYNAPIFKRGDTDIPKPKNQGDVIAFHNFTQPLNLTPQEIEQLVAFLKTL